jgi:rSAM/selenodomain-associated transferase 1
MPKDYLIVFLKYAEKGKVKTRLAEKMGNEFTLDFYTICAEHVFNICNDLKSKDITPILFSSEKRNVGNIRKWSGEKFDVHFQEEGELGNKMYEAFKQIFGLDASKAVIIGTDLPDLSHQIIVEAFNLLDNYDVVLGPAKDGGYYLLGLNKKQFDESIHQLFNSISWSTNKVLTETIIRIDKLKLKYKLLKELQDIDTEENLVNWLKSEKTKDSEIVKEIRKEIEKHGKIKN